ncbi:MAG: hypothetical protein LBL66_11200 [Clostridiales bacterium]|jgi:hypothetical protein|nr:hypothetical protein [Clostridiales bacterium]
MKKIYAFLLAVFLSSGLLIGGAGAPKAAVAAVLPEKSTVTHIFYDLGSMCEEQYTIELGAASQRKIEGAGYTTGNFLQEVEKFAVAYEALMFNPVGGARVKIDAESRTDFNLTLYIDFPSTEEYYAYYGWTPSAGGRKPDKSGLFADRYYGEDASRFAVPDNLQGFTFADAQNAAILVPVMTYYFLFGAGAFDGTPTGFSYVGLTAGDGMPGLLGETFVLDAFFENFVFYEVHAVSTRWVKTDADAVERHSDGFYYHIWKVGYFDMTAALNPNRPMNFTYIDPHVDAYYVTAFLIAVVFIGGMAALLVLAPAVKKRREKRE